MSSNFIPKKPKTVAAKSSPKPTANALSEKVEIVASRSKIEILYSELNELCREQVSAFVKMLARNAQSAIRQSMDGYFETKTELLKKYGEMINGVPSILYEKVVEGKKTPNPNYDKYLKEITPLMEEEIKINIEPIRINLKKMVSVYPYQYIFEYGIVSHEEGGAGAPVLPMGMNGRR